MLSPGPTYSRRWFGPRGWSLVVCEVDFRVGGGFRFVLRSPEGNQMGMRGTYCEIDAPVPIRGIRKASTIFPEESEVTTVLTESDGNTVLTATHHLCITGDS